MDSTSFVIVIVVVIVICVILYFGKNRSSLPNTVKQNNNSQRKKENDFKEPEWTKKFYEAESLMEVEDVFSIKGRGTVVTGKIAKWVMHTWDSVEIRSASGETKKISELAWIEMFHKVLNSAEVWDNAGLLITWIDKTDVIRWDIIWKF